MYLQFNNVNFGETVHSVSKYYDNFNLIYNSLFLIITLLCESYKDKNGKFYKKNVIESVWYL